MVRINGPGGSSGTITQNPDGTYTVSYPVSTLISLLIHSGGSSGSVTISAFDTTTNTTVLVDAEGNAAQSVTVTPTTYTGSPPPGWPSGYLDVVALAMIQYPNTAIATDTVEVSAAWTPTGGADGYSYSNSFPLSSLQNTMGVQFVFSPEIPVTITTAYSPSGTPSASNAGKQLFWYAAGTVDIVDVGTSGTAPATEPSGANPIDTIQFSTVPPGVTITTTSGDVNNTTGQVSNVQSTSIGPDAGSQDNGQWFAMLPVSSALRNFVANNPTHYIAFYATANGGIPEPGGKPMTTISLSGVLAVQPVPILAGAYMMGGTQVELTVSQQTQGAKVTTPNPQNSNSPGGGPSPPITPGQGPFFELAQWFHDIIWGMMGGVT